MAGRGRGRGRGMSFSIESLGFGRGENLPGPLLQPPPPFPPLVYKPVPLTSGEEYDYLLALKQEYRGTMKESPYYMKLADKKKDIERYSDKYSLGAGDSNSSWEPDRSRLPKELRLKAKKKPRLKAVLQPKLAEKNKKNAKEEEEIKQVLEALEKKEEKDVDNDNEEEETEDKDNEEVDEEADYFDEDDLEEETDYNLTYFDNGENFGYDEEDDQDDGPTY